ncbi:unnamed protein product [marine sediment metagenome]|uniref:Uncharacterized protein n=1 Tax=marine sediment metagenome TaxID=412755 RepID=X0S880_9ZZZZ
MEIKPFPNKKYQIIYADPPWHFGCKAYQGGGREMLLLSETQYPTMSIQQIKDLPVKEIIDKDCALFLWTTDAHLEFAIDIIKTWGFKYKTIAFLWLKKYATGSFVYNFAPWTLKSHEICLLGLKGKMRRFKKANNIKGLVEAIRTSHSKKPDEVRNRIVELFGNIPRIELFAREKARGWDVWGDEAPDKITDFYEYKNQPNLGIFK